MAGRRIGLTIRVQPPWPPRPSVSVIVCCYTRKRYDDLIAAIASLQGQTQQPEEVIVVVDHSPTLERDLRHLRGVVVIRNRHGRGLSGARNSGLEVARGDVIAFLDDDAVAEPDWLARLYSWYWAPAVIGVGGRIVPAWDRGRPPWFPPEFDWVVGCSYVGLPDSAAPVRNLIGCNMSFRREVFESAGTFRTALGRSRSMPDGCEETELCIRAGGSVPGSVLLYDPEAVVTHRIREQRHTIRYFVSRCLAEGRSKALVSRLVGARQGLAAERAYALRALPVGVFRSVSRAVAESNAAILAQSLVIAAGLALTTAGYLKGLAAPPTRPGRRPRPLPAVKRLRRRRSTGLPIVADPPRIASSPIVTARREATVGAGVGLGWLPLLVAAMGLGLLIVALADNAARFGQSWAYWAFWVGLVTIFAPASVRLASDLGPHPFEVGAEVKAAAGRRERLGIACALGLGLYAVKVLHSPIGFTFHDELLHWRTAQDILSTGHLFTANPLLPISAYYPGLELITSALATTHLSIFLSGVVLLAAVRLAMMIALFVLYEEVSGSAYVAGLGVLIYAATPNFVFWNSQFAYESLALPLAVVVLALLALRSRSTGQRRRLLGVAATVGIGGVILAHHLSSVFLVAFLFLWWLVGHFIGRGKEPARLQVPIWPALLAAAGVAVWAVVVAPGVISYVGEPLLGIFRQLGQIATGHAPARQFFTSGGHVGPLGERLAALAAVGIILAALPVSLWAAWHKLRRSALSVLLVFLTLLYPPSLALRIGPGGAEASSRLSDFLFIGLGLVLAIGVTRFWREIAAWVRPGAAVGAVASIVFVGGVILGLGGYARLPGPYLVEGGPRAIEPESQAVASWVLAANGPGNRVATDRSNGLLVGSYGEQHPVNGLADGVGVWPIFYPDHWNGGVDAVLLRGGIRFVIADLRLSTDTPYDGVYFESGEQIPKDGYPLHLAALTKFDGRPGVSRVYDSGDIQVYDVGPVVDALRTGGGH
jgi:GT2 family glycosyltransferase